MKSRNDSCSLFKLSRVAALLALCFIATTWSCASNRGPRTVKDIEYGSFPLNGMVYDQEGLPVQGASVILDGKTLVKTDLNGRFTQPSTRTGLHTLKIESAGYEKYETRLDISAPSEIAYFSVVSLDGLVGMAERHLAAREWLAADNVIERALAVNRMDPRARYLEALAACSPSRRDRDADKGIALLDGMLEDGLSHAAVYLLEADLFERDKNNIPKAIRLLERALSIRADAATEKRLEELRGKENN